MTYNKYLYILSFLLIIIIFYFIISFSIYKYRENYLKNNIKKLRSYINNTETKFQEIPKFYINLDRSKDRLKTLQDEILRYNIKNISRFEAIDGKNIEDIKKGTIQGVNYEVKNKKETGRKIELAITLSHLECIRKAKEQNIKFPIIILEDDIRFTLLPYWRKSFQEVLDNLPKDADFGLLTSNRGGKIKKDHRWIKDNDCHGGVAYIVTEKGSRNILKYYQNKTWVFPEHFDNHIFDVSIYKSLDIYFYTTPLFLLDSYEMKSVNKERRYYVGNDYKIIKKYK
jgi:hypothetical protein